MKTHVTIKGGLSYTATSLKDIAGAFQHLSRVSHEQIKHQKTVKMREHWKGQAIAYEHAAEILNNTTITEKS